MPPMRIIASDEEKKDRQYDALLWLTAASLPI
jgi:hypothetical protein